MLKLRPKYIRIIHLIAATAAAVYIYMSFNDSFPEYTWIAMLAYAVLCVLVLLGRIIYCVLHTIKFNTKRFEIKGKTYSYDSVEIEQEISVRHNAKIPTILYVNVDGKRVCPFHKRYKNFFEFKAVLKEHGIKVEYF